MPGRLLDRGAAAKVEVPAGKRGGATGGSRALEYQDACAGGGRADCCAATRATETDHEHHDDTSSALKVAGIPDIPVLNCAAPRHRKREVPPARLGAPPPRRRCGSPL